MNSINWKALWAWIVGFTLPGIGVLVPDMNDGKAPTAAHLWIALATALVGAGIVNMKRPSDHR